MSETVINGRYRVGGVLVDADGNTIVEMTSDLSSIRGISEKRANELKKIGVNTVEILANADAGMLVKALDVTKKTASGWINSAKKES